MKIVVILSYDWKLERMVWETEKNGKMKSALRNYEH